ncbi:hypothetical protein WKI40_04730 [Kosakonia sacchari]|uniref:hypothetical protein n=1 Tax=Kosakonia TaxID=1330547 RepID=UPI00190BAC4F|nr:hypothetical protein [Kosakonia sp. LAM2021]
MATAITSLNVYKKPLLLVGSLLALFLLFSLRNLDPILYPTVYAEDAVWTAKVIDEGFWNTAFNTRVFPILGFVLFYKAALLLLDIFCQGNLFYLPLVYFILSNLFLSLCVLAAYYAFRNLLSRGSLFCLLTAVVLMPVGFDGNEIYGRILNLGFIFPVLQVFLLCAVLLNRQSMLLAIFALLVALISCMTLPVGVGFQVVFGVICVYCGYKNKSYFFYAQALASIAIILASLFMISGRAIHDSGGADLPVKLAAFIEFALLRALLYPLLFSVYKHLNDVAVVVVFLCLLVSIIYAMKRLFCNSKKLIDKRLLVIAFIWASFGIYYLSIIVMRRGLSSLFNDYTTTFPDRYFLGVNILFVVALLVILDKTIFAKAISLIIAVPMVLSAGSTFELGRPAMKVSGSPLWTTEYCQYIVSDNDRSNGLSITIPPDGWRFHSLTYSVSEQQRQVFRQRCQLSGLYLIPLLDRMQPAILVQRSATIDMGQLPTLNVVEVHNVMLAPLQDGFSVKIVGDDPHIVLKAKNTQNVRTGATFHFTVNTTVSTRLQVYYLLKGSADYSEQNSVHFPLQRGKNPIYLRVNERVSPDKIRIDLPDDSPDVFIFSGIITNDLVK